MCNLVATPMTPPAPFDRILARSVVYQGQRYGLSLIELFENGEVHISPFQIETYSTRFVDGTVEIILDDRGRPSLRTNSPPLSLRLK